MSNLIQSVGAIVFAHRRRQRFRTVLKALLATPEGEEFFRQFLRDAGVTRPKVSRDPLEISFNEGKRHLAMSYLNILSSDDMSELIARMENDPNNQAKE
jgi:hypothetical protein